MKAFSHPKEVARRSGSQHLPMGGANDEVFWSIVAVAMLIIISAAFWWQATR